jgi:putative transposase
MALRGIGFSLCAFSPGKNAASKDVNPAKHPTPHRLKPMPQKTFFTEMYGHDSMSRNVPHSTTYTKRFLPHWQPVGQSIFITWRLYGSLPMQVAARRENIPTGRAFVRRDRMLDHAQTGPLWLKEARIAECVVSQLSALHRRKLFCLRAYVLMANHVHLLIESQAPLALITQHVKGATSREANLLLGRTGKPFWQSESFDHWIRNPGEWQKIRTYIERNPVAAGLVQKPEDWPWSSASHPVE